MSERKAINKYYPPDYDPLEAEKAARKLSKRLKNAGKNFATVRFMTPFSIRCLKCDEFIPKSKKFNGKKELLPDRYLGSIKIYRLTLRCPRCANSISFRTDPKSADYIMESGGVRNYMGEAQGGTQATAEKGETIDETLERLAKEQQQEEEEQERKNFGGKQSGDGKDRLLVLEENLERLQKEQEDNEYLEKLREANSEMRRRAADMYENMKEKAREPEDTEHPVELEFTERLNVNNSIDFNRREYTQVENTELGEHPTNSNLSANVRDLVSNSRKIKLKGGAVRKRTPFGIVSKGKIAKK